MGDVTQKTERSLAGAEGQLAALRANVPSLTEDNVEAAEQNAANLKAALATIREDLQRGAALSTSEDGISVIAGIQQYISKFQKRVEAEVDDEGEPVEPIGIPNDFAFGFDRYLNQTPVPEDSAAIAQLDKQRKILDYLLSELVAAGPQSIDKVEREVLEVARSKDSFTIDESISARVPGAIDTMAFSVSFTGYTHSLRDLLNSLAQFDLPIMVRDIKVKRPSDSVDGETKRGRDGEEADIYGVFGGEDASGDEDRLKPVVEQNRSQFTIILEFIEVVLPDSQNQEAS